MVSWINVSNLQCVSFLIQVYLSGNVFPVLKVNVVFSSGIQGLGLAPDWAAVQERRSDRPWVSARHCFLWNFYCDGGSGAHQQDGANHPGKLVFLPLLKVCVYCSCLHEASNKSVVVCFIFRQQQRRPMTWCLQCLMRETRRESNGSLMVWHISPLTWEKV